MNPNPDMSGLRPFKKGQSGNPKGRPRKLISTLVNMGYTKVDVVATIENMMGMTLKELADVYKDDEATILERTIAHAMKKSLDKGSLYSIETLINRIYGMPKQESENKLTLVEQPLFPDVSKDNSDQ